MDMDFADIKPSVLNWLVVGLMATTFILAMKFVAASYLADKPLVGGIADALAAI